MNLKFICEILRRNIHTRTVLIFATYLVAFSFQDQTTCGFVLILILGLYVTPQLKTGSWGQNIGLLLSSWVILSTSIYVFLDGQSRFQVITPWIFLVVTYFLIVIMIPGSTMFSKPKNKNYFWTMLTAGGWLVVSLVPFNAKVRLLGLGYDNYGHLIQARVITEFSHNFLRHPSSSITNVVTDTPQGAASALAGLNSILGNSNYVQTYITLYFAITLAIPVVLVLVFSRSIFERSLPKVPSFIAVVLCTSVIVFGHVGRIWFSGFFASNLATLLMCMSAVRIVSSKKLPMLETALALIAVTVIWPPLGISYGFILFIFLILSWSRIRNNINLQSLKNKSFVIGVNGAWKRQALIISCIALGTLSVWFTNGAIRRSFGLNQYVGGGGLEEPNITVYVVSSVFLIVVIIANSAKVGDRSFFAFAFSVFFIESAIITQSKMNEGFISYYPGKVVIGLFHVLLAVAAISWTSSPQNRTKQLVALGALTGALLFQYGISGLGDKTFTGGFVGRMHRTVFSALTNESAAVNVDAITVLQKYQYDDPKYLLYLSDRFSSELNTRWINTLNMRWGNVEWVSWMEIRTLIQERQMNKADALINLEGIQVIVDGSFDGLSFEELQHLLPTSYLNGMLCEFSPKSTAVCNG